MAGLTDLEQEIFTLREQKCLTYKAIGEQFHISPSRASQIFHAAQRKLQAAKRRELYLEENKMVVPVELSLGEIVVLRRILLVFSTWYFHKEPHSLSRWNECLKDVDYTTGEELGKRLFAIEQKVRQSR